MEKLKFVDIKAEILLNLGYYDGIEFIEKLPKHQVESAIDEAFKNYE